MNQLARRTAPISATGRRQTGVSSWPVTIILPLPGSLRSARLSCAKAPPVPVGLACHDRTTKWRMFRATLTDLTGAKGDGRVLYRIKLSGAFAALTVAVALSGCANPDVFDSNERWFSRSFDISGRNGGYTYSELKDTGDRGRLADANSLVSPNGACPAPPQAAAPAAAGPGVMPNGAPADAAAPTLLGAPIALGMTECQVVDRAGAPSGVQIGANPNGDRTAQVTYDSGPRPGVYHFERGRLMAMDRVAVAAPEPKVMKKRPKVAKKLKPTPVNAAGAERISTQ
jgi:hypothetical protein